MITLHQRPFLLREYKIEVTYKCNLNCVHCSSDAHPSASKEIDPEVCCGILREGSAMGARKVAFSGGEPLLWEHIIDVVECASRKHYEISIYTSGNVPKIGELTKRMKGLNVDKFIFSVFGGNAVTHERITRVVGSFQRTIEAIKIANNTGINTELHFVPISTNYRQLRDVVLLGQSLGVQNVSVLRLVPQGRAHLIKGRVLSRIQNLELRSEIEKMREAGHEIRTGSPYNYLMLSETPKCSAAVDRLIIGPDGRVYPCDAFKQIGAEELVGNLTDSLLDGKNLARCWENSPYLESVRKYLTTPFEAPCLSCGMLGKCLSGCLAQKAIKHGYLRKSPDPDCIRNSVREK